MLRQLLALIIRQEIRYTTYIHTTSVERDMELSRPPPFVPPLQEEATLPWNVSYYYYTTTVPCDGQSIMLYVLHTTQQQRKTDEREEDFGEAD